MEWRIKQLRLELKYIWKISRNASEFKENFIIEFEHNGIVGMGEVAPNVRYNENPAIINNAFETFKASIYKPIEEIKDLMQFLDLHQLPNALRFGIESAFIHWYCKANEISIHEFLGVEKPGQVATCYTLPIMEAEDVVKFYEAYDLGRFQHIKVKIIDERAIEVLDVLSKLTTKPMMIDANEAWKDVEALIQFLPKLQKHPILFVEQPMPAHLKEEYIYLKKHSPIPLMADESVLDQPDMSALEKQFHGINMKLMKAGGYLNGLRILHEARRRKMKTMVGCMVETTLGIHSAWNLCAGADYADLDGCLILANEPFDMLIEKNGYISESAQASAAH